MTDKPHLSLVWNRDWLGTVARQNSAPASPANALFDPNTLVGHVYQNALLSAAGKIPEGPLPDEALELFKAQVREMQNG
jgi:hypothetical protein